MLFLDLLDWFGYSKNEDLLISSTAKNWHIIETNMNSRIIGWNGEINLLILN